MAIIGLFILIIPVLVMVMVFLPPRARAMCFVLGLVFAWDFALLAWFSKEFTFLLLAPVGALISFTALLVEVPAFIIRTIRRHRAATGSGADG